MLFVVCLLGGAERAAAFPVSVGQQANDVVAYDAAHNRLFAADPDNQRVLVWDLAAGITNGMAAKYVLGQATFTTNTRNLACGGASSGTPSACGMAFPSGLEYDATNQRLWV